MTARVAVLIPCFNDPLVAEAVASIDEREPIEVVVVDDASTDPRTIEVLERLRADGVHVVRHRHNQGLAAARATGMRATTAPYVFPLDSDDHAVPGALALLADALDSAPWAATCLGDYEEFGDHSSIVAIPDQIDPFRLVYTQEYGPSLLRRSVLEEVGGWAQPGYTGPAYEDWHLFMSLAERGERAVHLGRGVIIYRRRLHRGRLLSNARRHHRRIYRELKASHPQLFAARRAHRRASDLPRHRKLLYPFVYGARPRLPFEQKLRFVLDRAGIWTLRR